jgi:hypothetical protein
MIDVNKITSTLAKLPDQQLQQYAQMHKNDPYIMALAMSESNRRKEMRAAGQGGQGMQEQPKVVDQMVAEMAPQQLPEEMGIGQLPAGEMNFAGGGIIAFADGGDVERYQVGGLMKAGPDFIRFLRNMGVDYMDFVASPAADKAALSDMFEQSKLGSPSTTPAQTPVKAAAPVKPNPSTIRPLNPAGLAGYGLGLYSGNLNPGEDAELARRRAMGPTVDAQSTPPSPQDMAQFDAASNLYMTERAAKQAAAAAPKVDAAPKADTRPAGPRPGAPASTGAAPSNQFDVSAMMRAELDKQRATPDPLEADRAALAADRKALAESNVTGLEAIQKNFDSIFSGRKARMDTREGEIGKMKDQTLGLALLNAGATMMSTRGNLGTAIGAGIGVGSKQYVDGMGRIEAAKEKLSTARDRLEELEAQRGELSARELFKANQDVKQVGISVKDDMIKARMAFNNESYAKAEKAVTAQLNANLEVYKQQQANLRNKETASAYSAGTRQDQVSISALKAQADVINKQLEAMGPPLKSTAAKRKPLEDELARITSQLQQLSGLGTMTPPPGAGSAGGASLKYNPATGKIE